MKYQYDDSPYKVTEQQIKKFEEWQTELDYDNTLYRFRRSVDMFEVASESLESILMHRAFDLDKIGIAENMIQLAKLKAAKEANFLYERGYIPPFTDHYSTILILYYNKIVNDNSTNNTKN